MTKKILEKKYTELQEENLALKSENEQLKKLIFGSKSERYIPSSIDQSQLNIFQQADPIAEAEIEKEQITYERDKAGKIKKPHPGRHKFPSHLPVDEVIIEPEMETTGMLKIGEEVSETLKYTPASLIIVRKIRPKYKSKETEKIHIADLPSRAIPRCIAENSLLAHIMVSKIVDHLPFYRQAQMFERDFQWKISRGTLCNWHKLVCDLLEPLYQELIKKVLQSKYIQADESPIKVLEKSEKEKNKGQPPSDKKIMQGYMWVYRSINSGLVFFNYRKGRGMHGPKEILSNYEGFVQCDGYSIYDKIGKANNKMILVGCHVHARRKFFDAKKSDPRRATIALEIYKKIYEKERLINVNNLDPDEIKTERIEKVKPLLDKLKNWVEDECINEIPAGLMGKAMTYFRKQWPKLINVLEDGNLPLDNNLIENQIRPLALGRKNYLFAGSHKGGYRLAMLYSFFASCKAQGINPKIWLTETLDVIADHPINKIEELLPGFEHENDT